MNEWLLRGLRSVGIGTLAGMVCLAALAGMNVDGRDNAFQSIEQVSWLLGLGIAIAAFGYPLPSVRPWAFVAMRAAALMFVYSVVFDTGQVLGDNLHWGPWWFEMFVFAVVALAALPWTLPSSSAPEKAK